MPDAWEYSGWAKQPKESSELNLQPSHFSLHSPQPTEPATVAAVPSPPPQPHLATGAAVEVACRWVASFFTVGCIFFVISGVAALVRPVAQPQDPTPGLGSLTAALLGWQDVIGANLFFFPGGLLQVSALCR